jgi:hypothetical protein
LIAPDTSDALGLTRILIFLFSSGLLLIASIARSKLVLGLKKVGVDRHDSQFRRKLSILEIALLLNAKLILFPLYSLL